MVRVATGVTSRMSRLPRPRSSTTAMVADTSNNGRPQATWNVTTLAGSKPLFIGLIHKLSKQGQHSEENREQTIQSE
jgi:hypothetical protein